jgi:hypothetical protein
VLLRLGVAVHLHAELLQKAVDRGDAHLVDETRNERLDEHQPLPGRERDRPAHQIAYGPVVEPGVERTPPYIDAHVAFTPIAGFRPR